MSAPPVRVTNLTVAYGDQRALDGVSLAVEERDFVGLIGPNGSGKTTLLRAILGLLKPQGGAVELFGECPRCFDNHQRVGYVAQHAVRVDPRFPASAQEVVLLGRVGRRGLLRRLTTEDRRRAREAMEEVGVDHLADRPVGKLSGGQRQRVFLAQALASEPNLLILDEPTTGVDAQARQEFYNLIDSLNHDHGMTILLVSHDPQVMQQVTHRVVVLNQRVLFDGTPAELAEAGGVESFYELHVHHGGEAHGHPA